MDAAENALHGIVEKVSAWLPGGFDGTSTRMSREYWMPDRSCRVCYECDSQFTIFNRRHHCRICGRVFCGKCTLNTIPASVRGAHEDCERVRVCNFCFKLRQQQENSSLALAALDTPSLTPNSSKSSIFSSGTSMTSPVASSSRLEAPDAANDGVVIRPAATDAIDLNRDSKSRFRDLDVVASPEMKVFSPSSFSFHNRSDDEEYDQQKHAGQIQANHTEEDEDDASEIDGDAGTKSESRIYMSQVSTNSQSDKRDETDGKNQGYLSSGASERSLSGSRRSCDDIEGLEDENFHGQLYEAAYREVDQPVDFENNKSVWIPPPPEDDEDELGVGMEDDDEDDEGGWGLPRSSGSMSSLEYRKERAASEEHRKAMRAVVDGHFRALVAQLLKTEDMPVEDEDDKEGWLEIVTGLALQAATIVKPDTSRGGGMDPGGYVKVKCIGSGRPSDSFVLKGVVCKKNLAHKRMTSRFKNPRLLLLGGALEYQRVSNQLSSLDTLLQQERDHLNMTVARIEAHHPNVLLVEKTVARFAQDRLLSKEISLVLNVKRPLLERIARCTGAQIISSPENLMNPKTGHCELFHMEKFFEEHGSAGHGGKPSTKTLMFFEGCPKPLGCTVLLKGANGDDLKKVKRVIQFAVFAAYHLALETSFLADEGASLPDLKSPIVVALPNKQTSMDRSITSIPGFSIPGQIQGQQVIDQLRGMAHHTVSTSDSVLASGSKPAVVGAYLNGVVDLPTALGMSALSASFRKENLERSGYSEKDGGNDHFRRDGFYVEETTENIDVEGDQCGRDDFPPTPSDHQSILVSLSTRSLRKGVVCDKPNIVRIKYYGNSDKPLGRFLRDTLFDINNRCQHCDEPPDVHIRCYTHRLGSLTISVRRLAQQDQRLPTESEYILPGEKEGKIWMWHRCLKCPRVNGIPPVTRRVVMSDAAWGLSFGKFLELSFSNHAAASRVAACGHALHRDCLRFYGFGNTIACFRYASIILHAVHLPPPKLEFNDPSQQDWLRTEAEEAANKIELVFAEILDTLRVIGEQIASSGSFSGGGRVPEARKRVVELEALLQKEKASFEEDLQKAAPLQPEAGHPIADVLELNKLRRELAVRSLQWDNRLHYLASSLKLRKYSDSSLLIDQTNSLGKDFGVSKYTDTRDSNSTGLLKSHSNIDVSSGSFSEELTRLEQSKIEGDCCGLDSLPNGLPSTDTSSDLCPVQTKDESGVPAEILPVPGGLEDVENDIRRTLSEGNFPIVADLSDTLDAAWVGEGHGVEVQTVSLKSAVQEVKREAEGSGEGLDIPEQSTAPASNDATVTATVTATATVTVTGTEACAEASESIGSIKVAAPISPVVADESDDLGNWIETPFSTLSRGYSRGSTNSSPPKSEIRSLQGAPSIVSRAGQVAVKGGGRLLKLGINGTTVAVYDDEPTSIIAYAILSQEYQAQMEGTSFEKKDEGSSSVGSVGNVSLLHPLQNSESAVEGSSASLKERSNSFKDIGKVEDPLLQSKAVNLKLEFVDESHEAKLKHTVTIYYAKHFDALRKKCCGGDMEFVRSLSRCRKWGAQGGKSNVFFAKSMDDRFIIKQVTRTELLSFLDFAPEYFRYLSTSINSGSPTCLAKILGMYQVIVKQAKGGKEIRMELLVMENLLYGRHITRLYDLKGSVRSRYNSDSTGKNAVLLDQNLLEAMPTAPIFVGNKAKRLLERAVWNDTAFLAGIDVMDYSLLVGVDEERGELVLGIIDFMRQYTWDKHLETWVKASGIFGGPKNTLPTVISPKEYKKRFRKAMSAYFVTVPDHWTPPSVMSGVAVVGGEEEHRDNRDSKDSKDGKDRDRGGSQVEASSSLVIRQEDFRN